MGIDVAFCNGPEPAEGEELTDGERVASIGGFFNLVMMMGNVFEPARAVEIPAVKEAMAEFDVIIEEIRELGDSNFAGYCEFTTQAAEKIKEMAGDSASISGGPVSADPSKFHPDARAFLGRLILNDRPISPELCGRAAPFIGISLGMFSAWRDQCAEDQPEASAAMGAAFDVLDIIRNNMDRACEENRHVFFSA